MSRPAYNNTVNDPVNWAFTAIGAEVTRPKFRVILIRYPYRRIYISSGYTILYINV